MKIYHIHKSRIWQLRWWQEDPRRSRAALYSGIILMLLAAVVLNNPPEEQHSDQSAVTGTISEPLLTEADDLDADTADTATPGVSVIPRDQAAAANAEQSTAPAAESEPTEAELSANDADAVAVAASAVTWIAPAQGELLRDFGYDYDPTYNDYRFHRGCDIRLEVGNIVQAAADGTVVSSTNDPLWGGIIVLDHGGGWMSVYKCLSPRVIAGTTVAAGESIGSIIDSPPAEAAQVSHLHWEVYLNEEATSPQLLF